MKTSKVISVTLALLLIFALFAGCSGSTTPTAAPSTAATSAPASTAPASAAPATPTPIEYPTKSINGYIAWAAGGATDTVMRTITPLAEKYLGQSIVLTNKTGGTGSIATQYVYTQAADGYTMLFNAENPPLYKVLNLGEIDYDNFIPVIVLAKNIGILVVPANSPFNTYQDFVDYALANPGKVNVGATGVGGLPFNSLALTKMVEGIEYNLVNFDGDGTLQPALIGGQVEISVVGQAAAADYVKSGQLRALAVYSNERVESMPDVPALGELNDKYKDPLESWGPFYGAFVKEGTDPAIVSILSDAFAKGAEEAKFVELCENRGLQKLGLTGDEAVAFIKGWQSMTAWALYDAGATGDRSPADYGIEKP